MRIARDHVSELETEESLRARLGAQADPSVDRRRRKLDERSCGDDRIEKLGSFLDVRVSLRMRKHDPEALHPETEEPVGEIERPPDVRHLDEQVARTAERVAVQLLLRPIELGQVELRPADELDGRARRLERLERRIDRIRRRRVVVTHMRRRRQHFDAVGRGRGADRQRLVQVGRAVVEARQDVRMEVDQSAANARYNSRAAAVPSVT